MSVSSRPILGSRSTYRRARSSLILVNWASIRTPAQRRNSARLGVCRRDDDAARAPPRCVPIRLSLLSPKLCMMHKYSRRMSCISAVLNAATSGYALFSWISCTACPGGGPPVPFIAGTRPDQTDQTERRRERSMTMTPEDVLRMAQEKGVRMVDFKFTDVPGTWQHFSVPVRALDDGALRGGHRLRRLQHPRLPGDQRERHAPAARPRPPPCSTRSPPSRR